MGERLLSARFTGTTINSEALRSVVFFPGLGIAYSRIQKNANTSAVILLHELETGMQKDRSAAKKDSLRISTLPWGSLLAIGQFNYFVIIRNPYSRLLSAFLDKFRLDKFKAAYKAFDLTPDGFRDFVAWLQVGNLGANSHWDLQSRRLFVPLRHYGHVVRFESLAADMHSFLASLSIPVKPDALSALYPSDLSKQTSASQLIHDFYDDATARRVHGLFQRDFEQLGYSAQLPG